MSTQVARAKSDVSYVVINHLPRIQACLSRVHHAYAEYGWRPTPVELRIDHEANHIHDWTFTLFPPQGPVTVWLTISMSRELWITVRVGGIKVYDRMVAEDDVERAFAGLDAVSAVKAVDAVYAIVRQR